jgi:hypothetical protein
MSPSVAGERFFLCRILFFCRLTHKFAKTGKYASVPPKIDKREAFFAGSERASSVRQAPEQRHFCCKKRLADAFIRHIDTYLRQNSGQNARAHAAEQHSSVHITSWQVFVPISISGEVIRQSLYRSLGANPGKSTSFLATLCVGTGELMVFSAFFACTADSAVLERGLAG